MNTQFVDPQLAVGMPGPMELFIILLIVIVVFGARKLPQIGEGLGKGIKNFKRAFESDDQSTNATRIEGDAIAATEEEPADAKYAAKKDQHV